MNIRYLPTNHLIFCITIHFLIFQTETVSMSKSGTYSIQSQSKCTKVHIRFYEIGRFQNSYMIINHWNVIEIIISIPTSFGHEK